MYRAKKYKHVGYRIVINCGLSIAGLYPFALRLLIYNIHAPLYPRFKIYSLKENRGSCVKFTTLLQ